MLTVTPTLPPAVSAPLGSSLLVPLSATASAGSHGLSGWLLSWGDGTTPDALPADATLASHAYSQVGDYCLTATASDDGADGPAAASEMIPATVCDPVPWVGGCGPGGVDVGSAYTLYLGFHDVGCDPVQQWLVGWGDDGVQQSFTPDACGNFDPFTHVYSRPGGYCVNFTAVSDGTCYPACSAVGVEVDGSAPCVVLDGERPCGSPGCDPCCSGGAELQEGSTYSLYASFYAPDGETGDGDWLVQWGDGSSDVYCDPYCDAGSAATFSHVYAEPGCYAVTASTDSLGGFCGAYCGVVSGTTYVVVDEAPITAYLYGPSSVDPNATLWLSPIYCDPGGDRPWGWDVSWGDGAYESVGGDPGCLSHTYSQSGDYSVTATAFGEDGVAPAGPLSVHINDVQASAWACGACSAVDQGACYVLYAGFCDPAGDPAEDFFVSWGDGFSDDYPVPAGANMGDNPNGSGGNFGHTYSEPGCYCVTLNVPYERGCATCQAQVEVDPAAPYLYAATDAPSSPDGLGSELTEGSAYDFCAGFSGAGAGHVQQWLLNWGDGFTESFCGDPNCGGVGDWPTFCHTYCEPGCYFPVATAVTAYGSYCDPASYVQVDEAMPAPTPTAPAPSTRTCRTTCSSPSATPAATTPAGGTSSGATTPPTTTPPPTATPPTSATPTAGRATTASPPPPPTKTAPTPPPPTSPSTAQCRPSPPPPPSSPSPPPPPRPPCSPGRPRPPGPTTRRSSPTRSTAAISSPAPPPAPPPSRTAASPRPATTPTPSSPSTPPTGSHRPATPSPRPPPPRRTTPRRRACRGRRRPGRPPTARSRSVGPPPATTSASSATRWTRRPRRTTPARPSWWARRPRPASPSAAWTPLRATRSSSRRTTR